MTALPRGWVETTLGEVFTLVRGLTYSKEDVSDEPGDGFVALLRANNIQHGQIDLDDVIYLPVSIVKDDQILRAGDIVLATSSGSRTVVGKAAIITSGAEGSTFGAFCGVARPNFPDVDKLLFQYMRSRAYRDYVEAVAIGTNINNFRSSDIQGMAIPLPPLAEQKRIVAKLNALNAKFARARTELARIETLVARYKQAVLSQAFSGELAREWPSVSLDLLSDVIFDGPFGSNLKSADYTADGPRVVRLENIGAREFIEEKRTHISEAKFRSLARHVLQANDLLFSSFISEEIRACLFPANIDFQAINKADCFCIRLDAAKVDPQFALLQLTSEATYRHFVQQVHGATRPRINLSQLKSYRLLVPPLEEQHRIVRRIESAFAKIDRLAKEAKRALELVGRLDEAILAKAFRGELVSQDENDEPAENLLARIGAEREAAPKVKKRVVKRTSVMLTARDFLNEKLPNWPHDGISFQDLRSEFSGSYDDLKDAVFNLLSDENAMLRQIFDEKRSTMKLKRREK